MSISTYVLYILSVHALTTLLPYSSFHAATWAAYIVELGYNATKGAEYFVWLSTNVVTTEEYNVMVNSEELIGTTENLTL
jgi:hypothetical protein